MTDSGFANARLGDLEVLRVTLRDLNYLEYENKRTAKLPFPAQSLSTLGSVPTHSCLDDGLGKSPPFYVLLWRGFRLFHRRSTQPTYCTLPG